MINCPYCGKLTDPKLESCVHCGGYLQRRQPAAAATARGRRQTCPNCNADVDDGAILCVACGTNLLTGQKIGEERKGGRRKKTMSAGMIAGIVGLVVALVVIGLIFAAVSRDPVNRAREMIADNSLLEAQEILRTHVADSPDDAEAQFLLGKVEFRNNRPLDAARSFERAFEADKDNIDALKLAVVSYAAAADPTSRANQIKALERIVEKQPDDLEAWYLLGLARGSQGDAIGQEDALRTVLDRDPTHVGALQELGVALALQGKYEEAQDLLTRAQHSGGADDPNVLAAQGFLAQLQGNPEAAVVALVSAVGAPANATEIVQTQLGIALVELGRFAEAEKHLSQALDAAGRTAPDAARFFHGLALRALGRSDEATSEFEILAKGTGPYAVDAAVQESRIFLERGNIARARELVESVATQASSSAPFYTTRGRIAALNGEDQRAEQAFQQAIQVDPNYPGGYLELGLLQLKSGTFENALTNLSRFLELSGDTADPQSQQIRTLVEQLRSTIGTTSAANLATVAPETGRPS